LPNPFLKWEETNQLDIGLDLGLFKDKLNLEIDYYVSKTNDLLFSTTIPAVTGFGNRISNLGDIENRGYEFTTSYQAFVSKNFSWNIKANIGVNRNKVLKIGEYDRPILSIPAGNGTNAGITQVGGPIGMFRGLKVLGLYTQQMIDDPSVPKYAGAVVGAPFFEDFDKNGVLDRNLDIQIVGNPWPDFTYGMTNTFIYKGFNLRIITLGEQGSSILDLTREFMQNTDRGSGNYLGVFNLDKQVLDRWRPGDTDFGIRPPTTFNAASSQRWRWPGSAGVIDGSFFKIGNITLTYSLGKLLKNIKGIRNANAGVTVQNVHYFKHFYANPEARRAAGGLLERNVYYSGYPVPRTYSFNFSVSL
jgi:TonB-dependent starch-binding outer membrane protein SusC